MLIKIKPTKKPSRMDNEREVENAVIQLFRLHGYFAFKNYDQAKSVNGVFRKNKFQVRGIADSTIITKIGVVYVEFKSPTGRQSPHQKEFERVCIKNGVNYFLCRSIREGKEIIEKIKELENGRNLERDKGL